MGRSFLFARIKGLWGYETAALAMGGRGSDGFDASCALMLRWGIKIGNFGWFFELFWHLALRGAGEKVAVCATRGELQREKEKK